LHPGNPFFFLFCLCRVSTFPPLNLLLAPLFLYHHHDWFKKIGPEPSTARDTLTWHEGNEDAEVGGFVAAKIKTRIPRPKYQDSKTKTQDQDPRPRPKTETQDQVPGSDPNRCPNRSEPVRSEPNRSESVRTGPVRSNRFPGFLLCHKLELYNSDLREIRGLKLWPLLLQQIGESPLP
jgi:hypothetical protein